ncbi:hypothetical protein MHYP_G00323290 [Metynnis hypsauchen]
MKGKKQRLLSERNKTQRQGLPRDPLEHGGRARRYAISGGRSRARSAAAAAHRSRTRARGSGDAATILTSGPNALKRERDAACRGRPHDC